jgi:spore germination cell wall hydrolase CwlJ-like protein
MTAPRETRLLMAFACLSAAFPAYGAVGHPEAAKAPARHLAPTASGPTQTTASRAVIPPITRDGAAQPFILTGAPADRERAEWCLTQAVYYEAATQPSDGQAAVAQTVLNRLRHPDYPKSVCGVVYEGSGLRTGCQFSFTCDGSLRRSPDPWLWSRAMAVAHRALNGYVMPAVGEATYYHADYVRPFWRKALTRITQIGAHIFYRWPGPSGDASAFTGQYAGHESDLSAVLQATDPRLATLRPAVWRDADARRPTARMAANGRQARAVLSFGLYEASYAQTPRTILAAIRTPDVHPNPVALPPVHPTVVATTSAISAPATATPLTR